MNHHVTAPGIVKLIHLYSSILHSCVSSLGKQAWKGRSWWTENPEISAHFVRCPVISCWMTCCCRTSLSGRQWWWENRVVFIRAHNGKCCKTVCIGKRNEHFLLVKSRSSRSVFFLLVPNEHNPVYLREDWVQFIIKTCYFFAQNEESWEIKET